MKKVAVVISTFVFITLSGHTQDYKKVRDAITIAEQLPKSADVKLEEAKAGIEKIIMDPKGASKAESFLVLAEVYGAIAGIETMASKYPNATYLAYMAFAKYRELDPSQASAKAQEYAGIRSIFNIYQGLRMAGGDYFNKKIWDSALVNFDRSAVLGDVFTNLQWWKVTFDTSSYLYAGFSAQNAQKYDEAIKYYTKIVDKNIVGPDYEVVYEFVPTYYFQNKNDELFKKYIAISKAAFPKNPNWEPLEFEGKMNAMAPEEMLKKFNEEDAAKTINSNGYADYADYFHSNKKIKELTSDARKPYAEKSAYAFYKVYELDTTKVAALFNAGVIYTLLQQDALEQVNLFKGATPDMKAKREKAYKDADDIADKAISYLEIAFSKYAEMASKEREDEVNQKNAARNLASLFEYKRERTKATGKTTDYDKYDKKLKFYDSKY